MTTQRTARVRIIATASADWTDTVEIPDDVLPDEVDGWIAEWARVTADDFRGMDWDRFDTQISRLRVTGEWTPDPSDPVQVAWAEAQRLAPTVGQTDIFGGEVA